jgi:hypothetical protein
MKDFGIHYLEEVDTGASNDGNWTQLAGRTSKGAVGVVLPSLDIPRTCAALLRTAQQAAKALPPSETIAIQGKNIEASLLLPIETIGFRKGPMPGTLLVNVGNGFLTLELTDAACEELKDAVALMTREGE